MTRIPRLLALTAALAVVVPVSAAAHAASASSAPWRMLSATTISSRGAPAMAFDRASRQLIAFGGTNTAGVADDTWVWRGGGWRQLHPAHHPPARDLAAMAYDDATGTVVLFGGQGNGGQGGVLGDTWVWNGTDWSQPSVPAGPAGRYGASLAYDPAARQLLLFGGVGGGGLMGDTWTWNGRAWAELRLPVSPPARDGAGFAYDASAKDLVLFGGLGVTASGATGFDDDTWTWNGTMWAEASAAVFPPGRWEPAMAPDGAGHVVLFGGYSDLGLQNTPSTTYSDTWTWNGSSWALHPGGNSPAGRYEAAAAFDPSLGGTVVFAGCCNPVGGFLGDTELWRNGTWQDIDNPSQPLPRTGAVMNYDPAAAKLVMFGGYGGAGMLGDTWTSGGSTWQQQHPPTSPPGRFGAAMAYDQATSSEVLFGGQADRQHCVAPDDSNHLCNDTWTWDGATWTQHPTVIQPPVRTLASMAYDPLTRTVMLFGGYDFGISYNDTWTWDGQAWAQAAPASSPPGRYGAALVWDPATRQLVLFGGEGSDAVLGDTWVWNGATWTMMHPAQSPPGRYAMGAGYDPAVGVIVTGGCDLLRLCGDLSDTWAWDGSNWRQLTSGVSPPARYLATFAYNPRMKAGVLFAGSGSGGELNDAWELTP